MKSLDLEILERLIFPETFRSLLEEVSEKNANVVADELKHLIVKNLVTPVKPDGADDFIYDSDNLSACRFRATGYGISLLENLKK